MDRAGLPFLVSLYAVHHDLYAFCTHFFQRRVYTGQRRYGILIHAVIAIGDERNDISMIQAAGIGVCMKNGHPDAKAVADYITENDHNNSGVAEVIYKYI